MATDVNAVPPAGVEGVGVKDNGAPIPGTNAVGIGALAVGNIKYKTEAGLFDRMIEIGEADLSRFPRRLRPCPEARPLTAHRCSSWRCPAARSQPRQDAPG